MSLYGKHYKARKLVPLEAYDPPLRVDMAELEAGYIGYNKRTWHGYAYVVARFFTDDVTKLEPLKVMGYSVKRG